MTESCVRIAHGVPRLFVSGKALPIGAYMTYYTEKGCYADFAQNGYRLFSLPVFFATRPLNDISQLPPFSPGLFEGEAPDFSSLDRDLARIVAACPDALIFPRVNVSLPIRWTDAHPRELCDTGYTQHHRECFSSQIWLAEVKRLLTLFIRHLSDSPYFDHIIGYQLAGGNTEEWFSFDMEGSMGPRSRESFPAFALDEEGYFRHLSKVCADAIATLARHMKELTDHRQVVGTFYGYTLECVSRKMNHHAMERLLNCPDIDFLCSPVSYLEVRPAGMDHANMTALDSLKLHGKLYFAENDTRTDLSRPPNDLPHYQSPVWFGPDREKSGEIIKMHFARSLCHGHNFWWFDMWGGWYWAPEYSRLMSRCQEIARNSVEKPLSSTSGVAVFVDEQAFAAMADPQPAVRTCTLFRKTLGYLAQGYDIFLAGDFQAVQTRYPCILLLEPHPTAASLAIRQARPDALVITDENADITAKELRAFCAARGASPLFDRDAVVYENESYLFLHTCGEGVYRPLRHLPNVDLFTGKSVDWERPLPAGHSYLFAKN